MADDFGNPDVPPTMQGGPPLDLSMLFHSPIASQGLPSAPVPPISYPHQVSQDPRQQLLTIAALGAMLGAGPRSGIGAGIGQGTMQGQQALQQLENQHWQIRQQQQQQIAAAQQKQQIENDARQKQLQSALMTITQRVQTLPDKAAYDQEIQGYANALQGAGYRLDANWLRQAVPYVAPSAEKRATTTLNAFLKNPANAEMIKSHPEQLSKVVMTFDVDGDGIPEQVPITRVAQIAKQPFAADASGQLITYPKGNNLEDKANADGIFQTLVAQAKAEGKNTDDPAVRLPLQEQAIKAATGDKAKGATAGTFEDYLTRYASEKGLKVDTLNTRQIEDARKRFNQSDDRVLANGTSTSDAEAIAGAIMDGTQPPDIKGLYRMAGPVRAALAKNGYDLKTANLDWQAVQKHIASMNSNQQLRLTQSINALPEMLDSVDALAAKWKGGRFPLLNRANLEIAKNGGYGPEVASVANQLAAQIADITADLGNVYMGGNSPTDHALALAGKSLSADWDARVLKDMVALARKNVQIRLNSIQSTGPSGLSTGPSTGAVPPPGVGGDSDLAAAAAKLRSRGR